MATRGNAEAAVTSAGRRLPASKRNSNADHSSDGVTHGWGPAAGGARVYPSRDHTRWRTPDPADTRSSRLASAHQQFRLGAHHTPVGHMSPASFPEHMYSRFLDAIERREVASLRWGYVDGTLRDIEVETLAEQILEEYGHSGRGEDLVTELVDRQMLFERRADDGAYRYR